MNDIFYARRIKDKYDFQIPSDVCLSQNERLLVADPPRIAAGRMFDNILRLVRLNSMLTDMPFVPLVPSELMHYMYIPKSSQ